MLRVHFLLFHLIFLITSKSVLGSSANYSRLCSAKQFSKEEMTNLKTVDFVLKLTDPCYYDKWQRPGKDNNQPININARIHIYFLGPIEAQNLRFSAHILLSFRWRDHRLALPSDIDLGNIDLSSHGAQGMLLSDKIWTPHLYLSNERESVVMGAGKKDIRIQLHPDGTVQQSLRMKVTLYCLMNLQKFPFDKQTCPLILESWAHNTSELTLTWEYYRPVSVNSELLLTEYRLLDTKTFSSEQAERPARGRAVEIHHPRKKYEILEYAETGNFNDSDDTVEIIAEPISNFDPVNLNDNFIERGNFSLLEIQFLLAREVGHYVLEYYIPSILLVITSWVSFWLDPNAIPGRTVLGTSTMLTLITLMTNTNNSLPKVAYVKSTEIWFLVCTAFIFASLLEFAFVNTIWRRKKKVPLKKVSSKYIIRHTMHPRTARRAFSTYRSQSLEDMGKLSEKNKRPGKIYRKKMLDEGGIFMKPTRKLDGPPVQSSPNLSEEDSSSITMPEEEQPKNQSFTTMTPQEIATFIDVRSRVWFPLLYAVFLCMYFGFVWL